MHAPKAGDPIGRIDPEGDVRRSVIDPRTDARTVADESSIERVAKSSHEIRQGPIGACRSSA